MPINYKNYAPNWKTEIRPQILERAGHRCEGCGVPNYAVVLRQCRTVLAECGSCREAVAAVPFYHDALGGFSTAIVLTIAHLDHDVRNNAPENLKALCQKCHLAYDAKQHANTRRTVRNQLVFDFINAAS